MTYLSITPAKRSQGQHSSLNMNINQLQKLSTSSDKESNASEKNSTKTLKTNSEDLRKTLRYISFGSRNKNQ